MKLVEMPTAKIYADENLVRPRKYAHDNRLVMSGFGLEITAEFETPAMARALASIRQRDENEHPAREIDYRLMLSRLTGLAPWERLDELERAAAREIYRDAVRER